MSWRRFLGLLGCGLVLRGLTAAGLYTQRGDDLGGFVAVALAQGAVLIFVLAFNNFAVPSILQTKVFPAELWVSFNTTFDYRAAVQLSWPMLVMPVLLLIWLASSAFRWFTQASAAAPGYRMLCAGRTPRRRRAGVVRGGARG